MNTDSNLNSLARTNWFAIIAEGDGAESIICCESELKQKLHAIYCVCGHDWDKCETEDIIQTIRTLDSDDSWTHDFLPNGRHIWRDRGEDYTVTVATLNGIPAVIREAIEKTLEHVEQIGKHGWMDSLHFDYHLGEDVQDLTISQTAESCKEAHRCIDTDGECTAKEVLVLDATAIRSLKPAKVTNP